ncbi:MAG: hypothetical protein ABIN83_06655 [Sphingomicrobium sp.]
MNSVQDLARTNPGAFLAGCTALGFIAARVFKAGSPDPSPPWSPTTRTPPVQGEEPKFRAATNDPASAPFAGEFA